MDEIKNRTDALERFGFIVDDLGWIVNLMQKYNFNNSFKVNPNEIQSFEEGLERVKEISMELNDLVERVGKIKKNGY